RRLDPRLRLRERAAHRRALTRRARLDPGAGRSCHGVDGRRRQRARRHGPRRLGLRHPEYARRGDARPAARRELARARGDRRVRGRAEPLGVLTRPASATSHRLAVVLLVTVVFAWALPWPIHKLLLATVPPLWAVALRTAIGGVALVALALATRRLAPPPRADLPVLLSITLLHMIGFGVLRSEERRVGKGWRRG